MVFSLFFGNNFESSKFKVRLNEPSYIQFTPDNYVEKGATATDFDNLDISSYITIDNSNLIDTYESVSYVDYSVISQFDSNKTKTARRDLTCQYDGLRGTPYEKTTAVTDQIIAIYLNTSELTGLIGKQIETINGVILFENITPLPNVSNRDIAYQFESSATSFVENPSGNYKELKFNITYPLSNHPASTNPLEFETGYNYVLLYFKYSHDGNSNAKITPVIYTFTDRSGNIYTTSNANALKCHEVTGAYSSRDTTMP